MISATPPSPERLVVTEEGAAAAAVLEVVVVMVLGGVGLMEMVQWWSLKTNYEWEGNQRRRGGERGEEEGETGSQSDAAALIVWRRFSTIDGVKKVCQQTALKYSCTSVTHVFTVVCVCEAAAAASSSSSSCASPRGIKRMLTTSTWSNNTITARAKTTTFLTFAAQNMAADRNNPSPGFGDPCAPSAPNTPSVSFHRLGWPPFPKADKFCDEWSPNLSRPYGPSVCPSTVSCVILTRYALIWLVISHVGWHVIEVGQRSSERREQALPSPDGALQLKIPRPYCGLTRRKYEVRIWRFCHPEIVTVESDLSECRN